MEKCPTCGRPRWSALSERSINVDECESQGGVTCRLATQRNSLVAAMKRLVHANCDQATKRACMVVLEEIAPSGNDCPKCGESFAVRICNVVPHYPKGQPGSKILCVASFGTVLGGVLFPKAAS